MRKIIMNQQKKTLSQNTVSFMLAIYIGLLLNSVTLIRNALSGGWVEVISAVLAAIAVVTFTYGLLNCCSIFGKTVYKAVASFVLLSSAAASYYMIFFSVVIGYGIILSTLTLDIDLSQEAVGYKLILWLVFMAIMPIIALWRINLRNDFFEEFSANNKSHYPLVAHLKGIFPAVLTLIVLLLSVKAYEVLNDYQAKIHNKYIGSSGGVLAHSYLPTNWIAGLGIHLYQLSRDDESAKQLFNPAEHFSYIEQDSLDDLYVVFVLGETTRYDHMGILGYERDTTPNLAKEKNLIAFAGTSCDTATKLSIRCMFVREGGAEDNQQRTLKERNVFVVLKQLGFTSELFAMQSEVWFYSSIDADSYELREIIASEYAQSGRPLDDMLLVDQLDKSIQKYHKGKHLVVLHTKGSHYLYSQRHTPEYARFMPECLGIDDACSKEQLINAYDNSVLYIDYMLKNTFDKLRDKNAIVFYASDHGESIDENVHFHATPREMAPPEQFRVPIMVWASDKFLASPQRMARFEQIKKLQLGGYKPRHEELFDSILGCVGYQSPDGGISEKNDWCHNSAGEIALKNQPDLLGDVQSN